VAGSLRGQYRRLGVHQKKIINRMRGEGSCGAGTDPLRMGAEDAGFAAEAWEGWRCLLPGGQRRGGYGCFYRLDRSLLVVVL
jgi:hypothetical protein